MTPKELPYFRFFHNDWMGGLISRQPRDVQGFFIDLCAIYWKQQCKGDVKRISQYIQDYDAMIGGCIELGIVEKKGKVIVIKFLKKQREELVKKSEVNTINGRKGGKAKALGESEKVAKAKRKPSESLASSDTESDTESDTYKPEEIIYNFYKEFKTDDCKMVTALKNIKARLKTYSMDNLVQSVKNYRSTVVNEELKYITIPQNFFGQKAVFLNYLPNAFTGKPTTPQNETNEEKRMRQAKANIELYTKQGNPEAVVHFEKIVAECEEQINVK